MIYSFFEKPYSDNQKTPEKEDDFKTQFMALNSSMNGEEQP